MRELLGFIVEKMSEISTRLARLEGFIEILKDERNTLVKDPEGITPIMLSERDILIGEIKDLQKKLEEEKSSKYAELIGQEHRLGIRYEQSEKDRDAALAQISELLKERDQLRGELSRRLNLAIEGLKNFGSDLDSIQEEISCLITELEKPLMRK